MLVALSEAEDDRLRPSEIGSAIQWEKSRLSHHLTRMQRRGLVVRQDVAGDARGSTAVLTATGRAAIEAAAPAHAATVRALVFDGLTPEQVRALTDVTATVLARLR